MRLSAVMNGQETNNMGGTSSLSPSRRTLEGDLLRDQRATLKHANRAFRIWTLCLYATVILAGLTYILGFALSIGISHPSWFGPWVISLCALLGSGLHVLRHRSLRLDIANAYYAHEATIIQLLAQLRHERHTENDLQVVEDLSTQWRASQDQLGNRLGEINDKLNQLGFRTWHGSALRDDAAASPHN